jgi:holo-[acyl-carrier protein] synthase
MRRIADGRPTVAPLTSQATSLTHPDPAPIAQALSSSSDGRTRVCVGIDTVCLGNLRESLAAFGPRFVRRLFTDGEQAAAASQADGGLDRLAARFAAKEATIKALGLGDLGVNWRDIEVVRQANGAPRLQLHGRAAQQAQRLGVRGLALSMSHDGDQACAVVVAWSHPTEVAPGADILDLIASKAPPVVARPVSFFTNSRHD